tara:strand:- start:754 stop:1779 length:1026 start_codon:yes stop_codon:yes gene_type:complete
MAAMNQGLFLAIETSCDETAVALARSDGEIVVSRVASQIELHSPYGGVVPELASRNHNTDLRPLVEACLADVGVEWSQIVAVAATSGPGLASSLLVGDTTSKAIAVALQCPFYSINHMEGHLLSPFIGTGIEIRNHIALVVSGGHTMLVHLSGIGRYQILGSTKDDAAGEAFDKVGKMLDLPYPGGPELAKRAANGNRKAYEFPRSMLDSGDFDFSFSGLKTSARYMLEKLDQPIQSTVLDDVCASFQEAIVDVLVKKLFRAAEETGCDLVSVSGGVSCNLRLRERVAAAGEAAGIEAMVPEPSYSTDNAAMIAFAAAKRAGAGFPGDSLNSDIDPNMKLA